MNNADLAPCATRELPGLPVGAFTTASPVCWVVRPVPRTAFYFIRSAMTEFIASVFTYRNRVSSREAFEGLEPDEGNFHSGSERAGQPRGCLATRCYRQLAERGLLPRETHSIVDCSSHFGGQSTSREAALFRTQRFGHVHMCSACCGERGRDSCGGQQHDDRGNHWPRARHLQGREITGGQAG